MSERLLFRLGAATDTSRIAQYNTPILRGGGAPRRLQRARRPARAESTRQMAAAEISYDPTTAAPPYKAALLLRFRPTPKPTDRNKEAPRFRTRILTTTREFHRRNGSVPETRAGFNLGGTMII